jgi:predicted DNA-binding antitoxin AbrB/MazE fold protein
MIRAIYRGGVFHPLESVPAEWHEGEELVISQANEAAGNTESENWLAELNAAASQIPDELHDELSKALDEIEAESKELARREMERSM